MGPGTHPRRAPLRVLLTPLDGGVGFAVPCAVRDPPAPSGTARSRQAKWPALSAVLHNAGESWLPRSDGARQGTPSAGSARVAVCTACAPWGVDETGPDAQFRATESASARRPRWLSLCRGDQPPTRRRHHRPPPGAEARPWLLSNGVRPPPCHDDTEHSRVHALDSLQRKCPATHLTPAPPALLDDGVCILDVTTACKCFFP